MTLEWQKIFRVMLALVIVVALFQNVGELALIFSGMYVPNYSGTIAITPIWVKVCKDFVIFLLISVAMVFRIRRGLGVAYYDLVFGAVAFCSIAVTAVFGDGNMKLILAGIRAFYPLMLLPLLRGMVDSRSLRYLARILCWAVTLMLMLQIFELFKMPHWDGANFLGLNKRNPGFFLVINSAGYFLVMAWICVYWHESQRWIRNIYCFGVIPVSIMLTASGSGVLALVLVFSFVAYFLIRQKSVVLSLTPFIMVMGGLGLGTLTQRENIYSSPADRLEILTRVMDGALFPSRFGEGTNAAVLLRDGTADGVIVDSTVNSLIYNLGIYGFVAFIFMVLWRLRISRESMMFILCILIFALSTVIYEIYPMNVLILVYLAYLSGGQTDS